MTKSEKSSYEKIIQHTDVPGHKRPNVVVGRGGVLQKPRKYHLTEDQILLCRQKNINSNRFVCPFRRKGVYFYAIESLSLLGENQKHPFMSFFDKMSELMGESWKKFANKEPKNPRKARDTIARVLHNLEVMQRLSGNHPYGYRLAQMGACINIYVEDNTVLIELKTRITGNIKPINQRRKRNVNTDSVSN